MKKFQTFRIADAVKRSRLQFLLTTTYTIITAVALLTFGLSLYFRYTSQLADRVGEDSVRLINQVNQSLDRYLRGLMSPTLTRSFPFRCLISSAMCLPLCVNPPPRAAPIRPGRTGFRRRCAASKIFTFRRRMCKTCLMRRTPAISG